MSYNITAWKLKKLDNLQVPIERLLDCEKRWRPRQIIFGETTAFEVTESCVMAGNLKDGILYVRHFYCHGECSGNAMHFVFEPALKYSIGEVVASCVWEGGESLSQLRVKDGDVQWVEIDI